MTMEDTKLLDKATQIVVAQLSTTATPGSEVPGFIRSVYQTLVELSGQETAQAGDSEPTSAVDANIQPAVPIADSITDEHIICLEDGKPLRMLKRYLMSHYGLTPEQYRSKWGLPHDYPMIAPQVSEQRSNSARSSGFGKANKKTTRARKKAS